eukprot:6476457-Amphidinium_carterae.1
MSYEMLMNVLPGPFGRQGSCLHLEKAIPGAYFAPQGARERERENERIPEVDVLGHPGGERGEAHGPKGEAPPLYRRENEESPGAGGTLAAPE